MAGESFKELLFGLILFALFTTLILTAVVNQGGLYGKDTTQVLGNDLSLTKFNDSISTIGSTGQSLRTKFERQSPFSAVTGVLITGVFDIAKSMVTLVITPFSYLMSILTNVLGVPMFVANVLLGLFIFAIILAVWSLLKIGG